MPFDTFSSLKFLFQLNMQKLPVFYKRVVPRIINRLPNCTFDVSNISYKKKADLVMYRMVHFLQSRNKTENISSESLPRMRRSKSDPSETNQSRNG
jgi:hypothetical protein